MDERPVRDRMYRAPTARERDRWHPVWLVARGWSAARVAEALELDGHRFAETSVAFLRQLRANHPEPLIVIWDNGPAHGGDAIRAYLTTPDLRLRLVRLPAYSPDFDPDEAIWGWIRVEVTAKTCFGTRVKVQQYVGHFFQRIASRTDEVKHRCRRLLQSLADVLAPTVDALSP